MPVSVVRRERWWRWAGVAGVALLLVAAPLVAGAVGPSGNSIDAGRLRDLVQRSDTVAYSGEARSTGSLALPELPDLADVSALFAGTTTVRAWYAGPDRYRVATLTTAGEHDLYRLPEGEYTWDYGTNMLTELAGRPTVRLPRASDLLPPQLARWILRSAPGEAVRTLPARRIAGVDASGLRLVPADPDTTIGQVDVWADPVSGLPVRVEVTARGQRNPVLVTGFEDLDQGPQAVTTPRPAPGSGFTVTDAPDISRALGAFGRTRLPGTLAGKPVSQAELGGVSGAALYGSGLSAFAAVGVPRNVADAAADAASKAGGTASGDAVLLSITPLSLAVVRPPGTRRAYLLAGPVATSVLASAGGDLARLRRSGR
ncbi:hypothetical protein [Amycolatopsis sp. PS_44_ISF1]|uniref:hypothetical protein n=1 Tax=Amycolatopsis sp. PS_44_ISF1 TaxID=2974917 RepID=UPI0028DE5914|nr:hypothetical protein [Amycolatopsis sp. PS_44_ISF1]MDT8913358.1 hypothetical protein [Amycolatopsis sp. PS_44_ISF1]